MNTHDGHVFINAEGKEENLQKFIEWCNTGPRKAEVSEVNAEEQEVVGYTTFEIRR